MTVDPKKRKEKTVKLLNLAIVAALALSASVVQAADVDLIQDDWTVAAAGWKSAAFETFRDAPIHVKMNRVKHADNGVRLMIVPADDANTCMGATGAQSGKCRPQGGFNVHLTSFDLTETLPKGKWAFMIGNDNTFFAATVHVHVIAS